MFNLNIRQALYILERVGRFTCTWPIDPNSSRKVIALHNVRWAFAMFNVTLLAMSLIFAVYYFRNNVIILMQVLSETTALFEVFFDLILCKKHSVELQVLIGKLKMFLMEANEHEIIVIQRYMDRYKVFFLVTGMGYMMTAVTFCFIPLFSAQKLPADGWIPFSIEPLGIYCIVYANQVYCILLTAFCISVDFTIAILCSFPAAKLDILGRKLRRVKGYDTLVSSVKEHQEIIRFVKDTQATVETLLFKTNATMGCAVICGALPLIYNQSLAVMTQFIPMVVSGCAHLFVISWPADDLRESSVRFSKSISDIQWLGEPRKTKVTVMIMMQRSQKSFLVRMGGLLPPLSLGYYSTFLSTLASYFMAMRSMIES